LLQCTNKVSYHASDVNKHLRTKFPTAETIVERDRLGERLTWAVNIKLDIRDVGYMWNAFN